MILELIAAFWGLAVGYLVGRAYAPTQESTEARTIHVHRWRCGPVQQSETIHTNFSDYNLHPN